MKQMICPNPACKVASLSTKSDTCPNCNAKLMDYARYTESGEFEFRPDVSSVWDDEGNFVYPVERYAAGYNHRNGGGIPLPIVHKPKDEWTCDAGEVSGCPIAKKGEILIDLEFWTQFVWMAGQVNTEWIAYLTGERSENSFIIDGFYFPDQKVSPTHCEAIEGTEIRERTIGTIHSHVNMGAFWSKEDKDHWNWPVEIVINAKGDYLAVVHAQLECGRNTRLEAKVVPAGDSDILTELEAAIKSKTTYTYPSQTVTTVGGVNRDSDNALSRYQNKGKPATTQGDKPSPDPSTFVAA